MAIFFVAIQSIGRAQGRSAIGAAAYRAGERLHSEREGRSFDYRRRQRVLATALVGWAGDRETLWNAATMAERKKNSVEAREVVAALPHELPLPECRDLAIEFADFLRKRHGVAVDVCLHGPHDESDPRNRHCHFLLTTRRVEDDRLGEKTRELDLRQHSRGHIEAWRAEWAGLCNEALRRHGLTASLDHRSHARRAEASGRAERLPQTKLGPAATNLMRRGIATTRAAENLARAAFNERLDAVEVEAVAATLEMVAALGETVARPAGRVRVLER